MREKHSVVLKNSLPDHFSFSAATTFQDCPKKWHYTYLEKAPRESTSSSLVFGGALHKALELIHLEIFQKHPVSLDRAIQAFSVHFDQEATLVPLRFNKSETRESLLATATVFLEEYLRAFLPAAGTIAAIEERISLRIPSMPVPLEGRIDLVIETRDDLLIVDAKTSRASFNAERMNAAAAQVALYAAVYKQRRRYRNRRLRGRFIVFRKIKSPRIDTVDFDLCQADLNRAQRMLSDTWALIQSAVQSNAFPARRSWVCKQCPFQRRCDEQSSTPP